MQGRPEGHCGRVLPMTVIAAVSAQGRENRLSYYMVRVV
jgi:hypothetical protein